MVAIRFMELNGWELSYPFEDSNGKTALANIIESCAASKVSKVELIEWFDQHKVELA